MDDEGRLRASYDAFNARDIAGVLAGLADDVDWPNAWEGARVRGKAEVRDYWTRQWAAIDPLVTPQAFDRRPDGRLAVEVQQVVRDRDGRLLLDGRVLHVYTMRDGLVTRMDVEEARRPRR
jgi:ketosteroid isomerase-like protein